MRSTWRLSPDRARREARGPDRLIAETGPEFAALFCGCVYAGAWPVPLPLPTSFGGKESYIDQIAVQLAVAIPRSCSSRPSWPKWPSGSRRAAKLRGHRLGRIRARARAQRRSAQASTGRYLLPAIFERIDPLSARRRGDAQGAAQQPAGAQPRDAIAGRGPLRSWLPWYHDMGLVGCFLSVVANQVSTDYIKTEDFARRPLAWLDMISRRWARSISYSPTFGYDICARRISSQSACF
jgi:fatty-acyl-CoA synthase